MARRISKARLAAPGLSALAASNHAETRPSRPCPVLRYNRNNLGTFLDHDPPDVPANIQHPTIHCKFYHPGSAARILSDPLCRLAKLRRCFWQISTLYPSIMWRVRRFKVNTSINWFIVEQLPVVPPETYETVRFRLRTAGEIVCEAVLELTYTAHDIGHVDASGDLLPRFMWDEERCLFLRAKLDAVFFHLYGVTGRDDVRYVYSTFPVVEREETAAHGAYRSRELCLAWMNAPAAGDPDAEIVV